ncbi:MAG: isopentenyl-diphosphate Delta-isomerase [Acidobacteria bacterium]|nr:isopentenyl-diphosphate Delta-isomerase [Acidobacteriota bacterium]
MIEEVVTVDTDDRETGVVEKMAAHRQGLLHRAFSIFVFDDAGRMLLQRRASSKYHSGGLWSNTCCSHPRPGESVLEAAHRRLLEEMGFDCPLDTAFGFIYRTDLDHGLTEHEYDHVVIGRYNGEPVPNRAEVDGWKWMSAEDVRGAVAEQPETFTVWFRIALDALVERGITP